jgi:prepilin signal peptidase PulO-like enzyme (type II secretory pathway)
VYPLWLGGLAWSAYQRDLLFSLSGSLVGFGLLFLVRLLFAFYSDQGESRVQPMGGGDIKCAGMIGAWLGPQGVLLVVLIGSLLGIAWGMGRLWLSKSLGVWILTFGIKKDAPDTFDDPRVVPAGACLVVAAWTVWMMGGGISAVF